LMFLYTCNEGSGMRTFWWGPGERECVVFPTCKSCGRGDRFLASSFSYPPFPVYFFFSFEYFWFWETHTRLWHIRRDRPSLTMDYFGKFIKPFCCCCCCSPIRLVVPRSQWLC
jgi:hypothetical protein